jgi:hypothetical protein
MIGNRLWTMGPAKSAYHKHDHENTVNVLPGAHPYYNFL